MDHSISVYTALDGLKAMYLDLVDSRCLHACLTNLFQVVNATAMGINVRQDSILGIGETY